MNLESRFLQQECYVEGAWRSGGGGRIDVTNPASGEKIGSVPNYGRKETRDAIEAAERAFQTWKRRPAAERGEFCRRMYEALMDHKDELGRILTVEMGKPLAEAIGEVAYAASFFKWFGEEARRVYGDVIPSPWTDKRIIVTKEPVGVVGSITPWNFPTAMIARKAAAALGAGCTIVCKPASQTPFSALAYGVIADEVGLPPGVLNVITGSASEIAAEFCEHPSVRKITFTGSTPVGQRLASAAMAQMKRVSMELGGNAPFIVFDDADLDRAVAGAMASKYRNSGQTCVCANRFLVQSSVYDAFSDRLAAAARKLKIGDGLEPGVEQGPLIDAKAVEKVEAHIADALSKGATLATGGRRHANGGTFFEPTVLTGVTPSMAIASDETFGPVAPLFRFNTEDEAIALANNTEYGLASYVYTRDLGRAFRMMERLEYGMVAINEGILSTEVAPFGGVKSSGVGREGSRYGLDDYLNIKFALVGGLG